MVTEIAKERLAEAEQSLADAEYIYRENISNLHVLTKLYHAMIYSILALFEMRDIGTQTHADLIERLESEYVLPGVFNKTTLDALRFAYDITHECDCAHLKQPEDRDIERLLPVAREFVRRVKEHLRDS